MAPYGGLKYPVRHEWSELQLADRKVAECASFRSQCSRSSLRSSRPAVVVAGARRSCSVDQQQPMRKTRAQARRLHIGPTSRPGDLVCLLFSWPKCDSASKLSQAYFVVIFETKNRDFRPQTPCD